jgi:hypothetical protein
METLGRMSFTSQKTSIYGGNTKKDYFKSHKAKTKLDSIKEDAPAAENEIINNAISPLPLSQVRQSSELSMQSVTRDRQDDIRK